MTVERKRRVEGRRWGAPDNVRADAEPIRIEGSAGYETRIEATNGKDNTPITLVQWLRFGGQTTLRIVASSPRDAWSKAFPRFRSVRDGIQPRG